MPLILAAFFAFAFGSSPVFAAERTTIIVQGAHTYQMTELHSAKNTLGSCAGNACSDVNVTYTDASYAITNHGRKRVVISIQWTNGDLNCAPMKVTLAAGEQFLPNDATGFCNPYHANYFR
jgi:hypothetical protein